MEQSYSVLQKCYQIKIYGMVEHDMEAISKSYIKSIIKYDIRFDISIKPTTWIGHMTLLQSPKDTVFPTLV